MIVLLLPTIASAVTSETTTELSVSMLYIPGRNFNVVLNVKYTLVLCIYDHDLLQCIAISFIRTRHRAVWCYHCYELGRCKCENTVAYQTNKGCKDSQLHV